MMGRIHQLLATVRRYHAAYQHRHAAYRSRMLYDHYNNASRDLAAALFAEQQAASKLERFGRTSKAQISDHNYRRKILLEVACIYGTLIALCIWNWW